MSRNVQKPDYTSIGEPGTAEPAISAASDSGPAAAEPATRGWEAGSKWALARLLAVIVGGLIAAQVTGSLKAVLVILAIVAMVILHEAGHFGVAKMSGMKVTDFYVGFGPKLWSIRRGETEYGVRLLPLGGFVRIAGMSNLEDDVESIEEHRTYRQASFPRRVAVSSAGSVVHFVLAFLLLWSLLAFVGYSAPSGKVAVSGFVPLQGVSNPARVAGLRPGDVVVAVAGHRLASGPRGPEELVKALKSHAGTAVALTILRGAKVMHLEVTPTNLRLHHEQGTSTLPSTGPPIGGIGIQVGEPLVKTTLGPIPALGHAATGLVNISGLALQGLAQRFSPHGLSTYVGQLSGSKKAALQPGANSRLESPIGIGRLAAQAANAGVGPVILLLFELNVFIGLFNMLPLLPLDGGQVAIAIYERIRSRRNRPYHADVAKLLPAAYAVILIMVLMGVTAAYLDVTQPLPNPFH